MTTVYSNYNTRKWICGVLVAQSPQQPRRVRGNGFPHVVDEETEAPSGEGVGTRSPSSKQHGQDLNTGLPT